ncbi:MAG TPA: cation:proton antiporter [Planctomycetota bacterium]|nr:cation:proton antiporter [Planctomycetota bacterium]
MQDPTFFLRDLVVLFGLATIVVVTCHKVGIPPIVGFLFTGVLAGPSTLKLIQDPHAVEGLAEVGVVLLLFSIGLEFSLESLLRLRSILLVGGGLQVALTGILSAATAALLFGFEAPKAVFLGGLIALSSTAIVLKLLADKAEMDSPQGRVSLGILIFQDLCVVPLMIGTPILAGKGGDAGSIVWQVLIALAMVAGSVLGGRFVIPWILGQVVRTRSRETFLLVIILLCLGTAWLSSLAGLSLALGAFIAGLVISQSEYSHQALGEIMPFRDAFSSLFLISIGMLLDVQIFADPWPLLLGVAAVIVLKALVTWGVTLLVGYTFRIAVIAGLSLAQIGEFSFVLAKKGREDGLIEDHVYQVFLAAAVMTMVLTPLLKALAPWIADRLSPLVPRSFLTRRNAAETTSLVPHNDHVILIGYGLTGRTLAQALQRVAIPYVVLEMNPETVKTERRKGEPIFYGDAASAEILEHIGVRRARVLVIAISDPTAVRRTTELARRLHPALHIIVRTRYLREMSPLLALGADEVIPEEFETSLEIFSRTLRKLLVPRDMVDRFVRESRVNNYGVLRSAREEPEERVEALDVLAGADMEIVRIEDGSPLAGQTLGEARIRSRTGATVLALRRGGSFLSNPPVSAVLDPGTVAILFGTPEQVSGAAELFRAPVAKAPPEITKS